MTVWSISPFFNELDVLEIRLATLDPLIDVFVLCEADVDQRGNPKPCVLAEALASDRFAPWRDKVRRVTIHDMPTVQPDDPADTGPHWAREHHQRNALERGMEDLHASDRVLIADVDEIPYPHALEQALAAPFPMRFPMDMHVYRLNWRWRERPVRDGSTAVVQTGEAILRAGVHDALLKEPAEWRAGAGGVPISSGWHLAYMGSAAQIAAKTRAIADDAFAQLIPDEKKRLLPDREAWRSEEWAQWCATTGADVFGRDERQAEWVDLNEVPPYVAENGWRFQHLIAPRPK